MKFEGTAMLGYDINDVIDGILINLDKVDLFKFREA